MLDRLPCIAASTGWLIGPGRRARPGPVTANDNRPDPEPSGSRANIAALAVVVVVAAALFWVVSAMRQHNAVQDCIDSGRKNCVELDSR